MKDEGVPSMIGPYDDDGGHGRKGWVRGSVLVSSVVLKVKSEA